jgi:hypothetical protein
MARRQCPVVDLPPPSSIHDAAFSQETSQPWPGLRRRIERGDKGFPLRVVQFDDAAIGQDFIGARQRAFVPLCPWRRLAILDRARRNIDDELGKLRGIAGALRSYGSSSSLSDLVETSDYLKDHVSFACTIEL